MWRGRAIRPRSELSAELACAAALGISRGRCTPAGNLGPLPAGSRAALSAVVAAVRVRRARRGGPLGRPFGEFWNSSGNFRPAPDASAIPDQVAVRSRLFWCEACGPSPTAPSAGSRLKSCSYLFGLFFGDVVRCGTASAPRPRIFGRRMAARLPPGGPSAWPRLGMGTPADCSSCAFEETTCIGPWVAGTRGSSDAQHPAFRSGSSRSPRLRGYP